MTALNIPLGSIASSLTLAIRITGQSQFKVRCWIASILLGVCAKVIGTKLDLAVSLTGDG